MNDSDIKNYTLAELEKILKHSGKSLIDFEGMPYPESGFLMNDGNVLLRAELSYDRMEMANQLDNYISQLNNEQKFVHDTIMKRATSGFGGVFFVYGYGGTGKTFIWKTLSAALRAKGEVVLNVASSGIASLLLPGGRTAHSRFAIPININEDSICVIDQRSDLAELIVKCKLIIWDEAPMMHKHCFEALDKAMRDILRFQDSRCRNTPFGGKTMVFGGDFRQILPIIPRGSRSDVVNATINSSYLWKHVEVLKLMKNMRLLNISDQDILNEMKEFSEWVAEIGDGTMGGDNDGICIVGIPNDIVLDFQGDPIEAIVNSTYPISLIGSVDVSYLKDRVILAPTNDIVERVNEFMMSKNK